jgi:hypothetical protein
MCQKLLSLPKKNLKRENLQTNLAWKTWLFYKNLQNKSIQVDENRCTTFSAFGLAFNLVSNKLSGSAKSVCFNHYLQCSLKYKWKLVICEEKFIHFKH